MRDTTNPDDKDGGRPIANYDVRDDIIYDD